MTDPPPPDPRVLAGRYVLQRRLGVGGAGSVWQATDQRLGRTVAVKMLDADIGWEPETRARLHTEAAAAAKLNHPHVVTVYDVGEAEGDYLVMELVDGGTLEDMLEHGPLPPEVVATVADQVGRALGAAHARGIVHCDVKPANVLLTVEGIPKVADFGIARALGEATSRLTAPGQIVGTARYLAPEQLRQGQPDARADVYALGLVLHQLLTGQPPFGEGTPAEVAMRRLSERLPRPAEVRADVPAALDDAIERATRLDPGERFADGTALAQAVGELAVPHAPRELARRLTSRGAAPQQAAPQQAAPQQAAPQQAAPQQAAPQQAAPSQAAPSQAAPSTDIDRQAADQGAGDPTASLGRPAPAELDAGNRGRSWRWGLAIAAVLLLGGGVAVLTTGEEPQAEGPPVADDQRAEAEARPDETAVGVVDGGDHDPFGSGSEHADEVAHAYDGDPATAWQTSGYRGDPQLGGLKPGVGVWLELSDPRPITEVTVTLGTPGAAFTLFAGDAPPGPGAAPDQWGTQAASVPEAGREARIELDEPVEGRVWLLWFTSLPADGGEFRARVSDVRFAGP